VRRSSFSPIPCFNLPQRGQPAIYGQASFAEVPHAGQLYAQKQVPILGINVLVLDLSLSLLVADQLLEICERDVFTGHRTTCVIARETRIRVAVRHGALPDRHLPGVLSGTFLVSIIQMISWFRHGLCTTRRCESGVTQVEIIGHSTCEHKKVQLKAQSRKLDEQCQEFESYE
jgi:hypothetical protein